MLGSRSYPRIAIRGYERSRSSHSRPAGRTQDRRRSRVRSGAARSSATSTATVGAECAPTWVSPANRIDRRATSVSARGAAASTVTATDPTPSGCDAEDHDTASPCPSNTTRAGGCLMSTIKLTYFDFPGGRGEDCRIALFAAGADFEDDRVRGPQWPEVRARTPYGKLPVLSVDGKEPVGGSNPILAFIGRQHGLHPSDPWEAARHEGVMDAVEAVRELLGTTSSLEGDEKKRAREALAEGALQERFAQPPGSRPLRRRRHATGRRPQALRAAPVLPVRKPRPRADDGFRRPRAAGRALRSGRGAPEGRRLVHALTFAARSPTRQRHSATATVASAVARSNVSM